MSLKKQALSGIKWTTMASIVNTIVQIVQLAILARLLNPTDFGLMALVMVVIGFSQMFIDMGLSNAIIYKQEITREQLSSLYWLNVFIGVLFFILLVISSPLIAHYYKNEKLIPLINLVAVTFLMKPWGQQFMILMQKKLHFSAIAKTDMVSRFISFIVVVAMAYKSFGVYSLAVGSLVFTFFSTIGYIVFGRNLHKPIFYLKIKLLSDFLSFGLYQMGEKIIQYFASQFDTILIGKLLGLEVLGIYNVAKNLVNQPISVINPVITKVTFPLMSQVNNDNNKLKAVFLKTINYLSFVNIPVYLMIFLLANPIVTVMFGAKWLEAVPLVQILSLALILGSIGNPAGSLLLSKGKANIAFYWNLIIFLLFPVLIIIGSFWGIIGIAFGILFLYILLFYPNWKFIVNKMVDINLREYLLTIFNPFLLTIISIAVVSVPLFFIESSFLKILVGCLAFGILYSFLLFKYEYELFTDLISFIPGNVTNKLTHTKIYRILR